MLKTLYCPHRKINDISDEPPSFHIKSNNLQSSIQPSIHHDTPNKPTNPIPVALGTIAPLPNNSTPFKIDDPCSLGADRALRRTTTVRYKGWLDASKSIGQIERPNKTLRNSVDSNGRFLSFSLQPDLISGGFLILFAPGFGLTWGRFLCVVFPLPERRK